MLRISRSFLFFTDEKGQICSIKNQSPMSLVGVTVKVLFQPEAGIELSTF